MQDVAAPAESLVCVYGAPLAELAPAPSGARQVSPLVPGSTALESIAAESLEAAIVAAGPPARWSGGACWPWRCGPCGPAARWVALALKERGGSRLGDE